MITLASILCLGFFLGIRHATDADHLVAITTIVSRERSLGQAALRGMFWGIGHTVTLVFVGGAMIVFGLVFTEKLGLTLEFSVALMLLLLGIWNLTAFRTWLKCNSSKGCGDEELHTHVHSHHDFVHTHPHGHSPATHGHDEQKIVTVCLDRRFRKIRGYGAVRPVIVGVVHGLAGSAAVALLVLPLVQKPLWGILYLAIFGAGTIAGMMLITAAIALPVAYAARQSHRFHRGIGLASGFASLCFGVLLIYQIGFVQGLFVR